MDRYQVYPSAKLDARELHALVLPGKVHSRTYTDVSIFELELARIFERTWVYVGHASEISAPGDYRTRRIGRQPVILIRGDDGRAHVLMNRCRHRGAVVCEHEAGNTRNLRCWFHGWTYDTRGRLLAASTGPGAYGAEFDQEAMGLTPAARVEEYRGFIFASLSATGESLRDHLGNAAAKIDLLVDASPESAIMVDAGVHKTVYRGNWKLVGMDGYHPNSTHVSVVDAWRRKQGAGMAATHPENPFDDASASRTRDLGNGHVMLDLQEQRLRHLGAYMDFLEKIPGGKEYVAGIRARHPEARAKLLVALAGDPHVGIYPNLQLIGNQIRIVNPIAPDETEVLMFGVRLKGVSEAINATRLRQHESFYGPAGSGSPDDAEIFERVQRGMMAQVDPWIDISRGLHREVREPDGSIVGLITDEVTQRGQMRRWLELMAGAA